MRLNKERIKKIMKDYNNFNIVYFNKKSKRAYDCYYIYNNELIRINHLFVAMGFKCNKKYNVVFSKDFDIDKCYIELNRLSREFYKVPFIKNFYTM